MQKIQGGGNSLQKQHMYKRPPLPLKIEMVRRGILGASEEEMIGSNGYCCVKCTSPGPLNFQPLGQMWGDVCIYLRAGFGPAFLNARIAQPLLQVPGRTYVVQRSTADFHFNCWHQKKGNGAVAM
ncbi:unnamed protein product [Eretmochelys imbricata]